jgi:hypothetical protein
MTITHTYGWQAKQTQVVGWEGNAATDHLTYGKEPMPTLSGKVVDTLEEEGVGLNITRRPKNLSN